AGENKPSWIAGLGDKAEPLGGGGQDRSALGAQSDRQQCPVRRDAPASCASHCRGIGELLKRRRFGVTEGQPNPTRQRAVAQLAQADDVSGRTSLARRVEMVCAVSRRL